MRDADKLGRSLLLLERELNLGSNARFTVRSEQIIKSDRLKTVVVLFLQTDAKNLKPTEH
jgi:hypothetical protein